MNTMRKPQPMSENVAFTIGGCVALIATQSSEPGGGASLAFEVADLAAWIAQLDAKGIYVDAPMVHSPVCRIRTEKKKR